MKCSFASAKLPASAVIQHVVEIKRILDHLVKIGGGGAPLRRPACATGTGRVVPELNRQKSLARPPQGDGSHDVYFMHALTGQRNGIVVSGFFESLGAHDDYSKKLKEDSKYQEMMKGAKLRESIVLYTLRSALLLCLGDSNHAR